MIAHSKSTIDELDVESVVNCIKGGLTTHGYVSKALINELCNYRGHEYGLLFSSGSAALYYILRALGLEKHELLLPEYICPNVHYVAAKAKVNVVTYDNLKNSWVANGQNVIDTATQKTKAVLVNHTFGIPFEGLKEIRKVLPSTYIIEDCCHAIPKDNKIRSVDLKDAMVSFYSFNSTKMLAGGEGGAITTNDRELIREIEKIRVDNGLSDLTASLVLSQLSRYDSFVERRIDIANRYLKEISNVAEHIRAYADRSIFFRFPILVNEPSVFLKSKKVAFRKGVDTLISQLRCEIVGLPNTQSVFDKTVSVPIYPSLTTAEQNVVIKIVNKCL